MIPLLTLEMTVACICVLGGGIAQVADTHFEGVIVLGRLLIGLGVGMFTVTSLLYIGEVAPPMFRGPALMMYQFLQSCSQLVASGMAQGTQSIHSAASYKILMGGLILLPVIMLIGLPFIPETPTWLVSKSRNEKAEKALRRIHKGTQNYDPTVDVTILKEAVHRDQEDKEGTSWLHLVSNPIERRKLMFSCGALFTSQINGIIFFYVYGVIFAQAIGIKQPFIISLITNTLQIFAVGASVILGNKVRRRINLIATSFIMIFAFLVIGGIGTRKTITTAGQYIIVIFSYFVIVAYNFGPGPLAYTIAREMAVGANQNKILSVSIIVFYFTIWLTSFTAPYLYYSANLGPMLGFVYAGTTCLSILYTWFCVGETAGRTNLELTLFFQEKIPVRKWRTHSFAHVPEVLQEHMEMKNEDSEEQGEKIEYNSKV